MQLKTSDYMIKTLQPLLNKMCYQNWWLCPESQAAHFDILNDGRNGHLNKPFVQEHGNLNKTSLKSLNAQDESCWICTWLHNETNFNKFHDPCLGIAVLQGHAEKKLHVGPTADPNHQVSWIIYLQTPTDIKNSQLFPIQEKIQRILLSSQKYNVSNVHKIFLHSLPWH